jgi:hypothetical protein
VKNRQQILESEITELETACKRFCEKSGNYILVTQTDLDGISTSSDVSSEIKSVLDRLYQQHGKDVMLNQIKWSRKVADFCVKLLPLAKFCLCLTAPAAEVDPWTYH